ncbi:dystroglycan 1 isoform X2 [Achroia grisella]|uniref:dystroglycan 1 isoform X2 n=1 Tax=Achroia grisella TaxID=688607 RepID=UPI0027D334EE|nr:dystroglycan 1 isoform X2 [Achroia grisella]
MGRARYIACAVLLLCPLALSRHDDDFAFDNSDEFQVELTANHSEITRNGLRRLWGVPDTSAYVGHLFRMEIPKEAFSGEVQAYKVRRDDGRHTPNWLAVDSKHGLISGLPQQADLGAHTFTVTAHGRTRGLTATDSFTIEVKKAEEKPQSKYGSCVGAESRLVLVILVDGAFHHIVPRQRIRALMELAKFMALDGDEFWMEPYKAEVDHTLTVLKSGAGNTQHRRGGAITAIYLNVGCKNKVWPRHQVLVAGLREQARDGSLAHVLQLPVLGWRLAAAAAPRRKRQLKLPEGSGGFDYDNEDDGGDADLDADGDYSGYDDNNDDYDYSRIDDGAEDKVKITPYDSASEASNVNHTIEIPVIPRRIGSFPAVLPEYNVSEVQTTTEMEAQTVVIRGSDELPPVSSSEQPTSSTPSSTTSTSTSTTTLPPTTTQIPETSTSFLPIPPVILTTVNTTSSLPPTTLSTAQTTLSSSDIPTTTSVPETTIQEVTKQDYGSSQRSSTIIGLTTETVTFAMNTPPTLKHHMKKLAITAGKAFRYIIPADLFTDAEDGTNLSFTMYEAENVPLRKDSWIQFIPASREVYGLPLEKHVSRWNFIVEAKDSEGAVARGPLDITVQQHKSGRTINHQFVMNIELSKPYSNVIDWQIRVLEGIVNLFRDTDMHHLTVLKATQTDDICEFVWTNDTLPKDPACPMDDINRLMKIMESETEAGAASARLSRAMTPQLRVVRVRWEPRGRCDPPARPAPAPPAARPAPPAPATRAPDAFPPVSRNQVDHLTAVVGQLLVHKVPEDTFFDPEDGGTRNLALSLRYSDRSELPAGHWLQFDTRNQEFYGLPAPSDEGSVHYQLIAEDSSKKSAYDSLIVEVVKSPTIRPTVEFQMTMEYPFAQLAYDANNKRKVVEKLAALFGQKSTDNIRINSITDNPTTIIWYNTSLPMDRCPKKEIEELRKMIIVDERGSTGGALKENVDHVFDKDFKVMSIRLIPLGLCAEQNTKVPKTTIQVHPGSTKLLNSKADSAESGYLVTFIIPAVVIVCMILVAGIIACVLYRRRRTGKMSVGDEEERQAFRSKGIPVIFQDELEERADTEPAHKSPIIMREEKPPLLPPAPDYRGGEDVPYRPPPPFPASRTPPRPKATPTYRKPPPYVPP